jgi:hypothetical protein
MLVKCLYCDVENDALATSGYCESCGKKLPACAMVRTKRAIAAGTDGDLAPAAAASPRSRTADALLTTAVVQLACGGLFLVLGPALFRRVPETFLPLVLLFTVVPAVGLAGLGLWARRQPRPAALAATGLYVAWAAAGFLIHLGMAEAWLVVHAVVAALLGWVVWVSFRSG